MVGMHVYGGKNSGREMIKTNWNIKKNTISPEGLWEELGLRKFPMHSQEHTKTLQKKLYAYNKALCF